MINRHAVLACVAALALGGGGAAQLVPRLQPVGGTLGRAGSIAADISALPNRLTAQADALVRARVDRIAALVRAHPEQIALDPQGNPARAGEVVIDDPDDALIAAAGARGYRVIERGDILGVGYVRFMAPASRSLKEAIHELRRLGAKQVSADQLHTESGVVLAPLAAEGTGGGPAIGMIDSGVAGHVTEQRGFAAGAPRASNHGSAVASLIVGDKGVRGAASSAQLYAADVYGSDPAGGNATAIAKALGWLVGAHVPVVTISLVGPPNPLLGRVVAAAQARGTIIVAAVGNDGPAAPPSYPASYPGVIAVTGVDARNRVLIEAGRATHLDYAAPGADMLGANAAGVPIAIRGTSFAAPLVAATILASYPHADMAMRATALATVDAHARKLGARYGRGLVCGDCRTPPK